MELMMKSRLLFKSFFDFKNPFLQADAHVGNEPITALQAAWNVTNAIQGMFIVGLPIAVKVRKHIGMR